MTNNKCHIEQLVQMQLGMLVVVSSPNHVYKEGVL